MRHARFLGIEPNGCRKLQPLAEVELYGPQAPEDLPETSPADTLRRADVPSVPDDPRDPRD